MEGKSDHELLLRSNLWHSLVVDPPQLTTPALVLVVEWENILFGELGIEQVEDVDPKTVTSRSERLLLLSYPPMDNKVSEKK